jgi:hypothetical protein
MDLWSSTDIALYERRGLAAWTKVDRTWPALRRSLLLEVQMNRVAMLDEQSGHPRSRCARPHVCTNHRARDLIDRHAHVRWWSSLERDHYRIRQRAPSPIVAGQTIFSACAWWPAI